ncbi:MAG: hemerythrin domain-containing protein [Labilithrix sp.]|nr:hemerythrin domain-containing protein [Labilithrix sp.]
MHPPFVQLERSHRRIEEACEALAAAARDHDIETASDVCAFFSRQVRRHEEDEERSLFPRLVDRGAPPELLALLERLTREHREHEAVHARLEEAVSGRFEGDPWSELRAIAALLTETYRAHLEREEAHLFPAAKELLGADAIDAIGREMAARRGR